MIKYIASDCDGVLTDGMVYVDQYGKETRRYCTHDSQNIQAAKDAGIEIILLTAEKNKCHARRAKKIGLPLYVTEDKARWSQQNLNGEPFIGIADTGSDAAFLALAKIGYIPNNAPLLENACDKGVRFLLLKSKMGCGCLDEVIRLVLDANNAGKTP
jgi:3-deoxy-D-manno-octulosonate 8-phosphate phosphatase KdsC-like HAD superfamily phosphatase